MKAASFFYGLSLNGRLSDAKLVNVEAPKSMENIVEAKHVQAGATLLDQEGVEFRISRVEQKKSKIRLHVVRDRVSDPAFFDVDKWAYVRLAG